MIKVLCSKYSAEAMQDAVSFTHVIRSNSCPKELVVLLPGKAKVVFKVEED